MNLRAAYTQYMNTTREPYPSDVSDDEWQFVVPHLTLMRLDAPQRDHDLRDVFDALRWMARAGAGWRLLPHDFPPWAAVYQQTQRWLRASVFETITHGRPLGSMRILLRLAAGRDAEPTAAIFDARTLQSTVESGGRAGYDGYKRKRGSKVHLAVDTLGHLLALYVTPANIQERAVVADLAARARTGQPLGAVVRRKEPAQWNIGRWRQVVRRHDKARQRIASGRQVRRCREVGPMRRMRERLGPDATYPGRSMFRA